MSTSPDSDRNELPLEALEYLLGDARGDDVPFERRLLDDPAACDCLADLVLLKDAAAAVRDVPARVSPPASTESRPARTPGWVKTLAGLAAMLLLGLWLGYQWGDHQDGEQRRRMADDGRQTGSTFIDPSIVWHSELINAWSDLSEATEESDESLSDDELDAAYDAASPIEWTAESSVPDWMWTAVSISAMEESSELQNDDDFEFEETL